MSDVMEIRVPPTNRKHKFYTVEVDGQSYWFDSTDARKRKSFDSVKLYQKEGEHLVFKRYIRRGLLYL